MRSVHRTDDKWAHCKYCSAPGFGFLSYYFLIKIFDFNQDGIA